MSGVRSTPKSSNIVSWHDTEGNIGLSASMFQTDSYYGVKENIYKFIDESIGSIIDDELFDSYEISEKLWEKHLKPLRQRVDKIGWDKALEGKKLVLTMEIKDANTKEGD